MREVLNSIDYVQLLQTLWTVVLVPVLTYVATQVHTYAKEKKIDKYTDILYDEVIKAVKSVYETSVKDIKNTSDWTPQKQEEIKEIAKEKTVEALSSTASRVLKEANPDFEAYLDNLIGTALYDIKHGLK